jgi:RNA-directed DNA polymerase
VPKEDGSQRPMGRPACEDKSLQRAGAMWLGAIDEQDVHECLDGFREGRGLHQALHMWRERGIHARIGWIIDAEVRAFFDSLDHDLGCEVRTPRVNDGAIRRLIRQWLRAGVLEEEPDASSAHVLVCGGTGGATTGSTRKPTRWTVRR